MSERVHSIESLRAEFSALLREYMQHLEPTAGVDVTAIRCEAIGDNITVFIDLPVTGKPYMQITMAQIGKDSQPVEPSRGRTLFRGAS